MLPHRPAVRWVGGVALPLALLLAACGGGTDGDAETDAVTEDDAGPRAPDDEAQRDEPLSPADEAEALRIHVTNDDGFDAPGLDVVVEALKTLDDVELTVIAPREDWSGSGDRRDEDDPAASDEQTRSGEPAIAVDGTPADTVAWAHEDHFIGDVRLPHLTVSGSNAGQNIGWVAYISGTVGAARESARRDVPALAVSQEFGEDIADYDLPDYEAAVPFLLDWIEDQREALLAGQLPTDVVSSLNVPTCRQGEVRGLFETTRDPREQGEEGLNFLEPSDCTSGEDPEGLQDAEAFQLGFATLTPVDVEEPPSG